MRLTLRTLLAYLDDILEPANAREIGQKVQESTPATNLVNRIREVMRRRRLTAPDLEGPNQGLSANVVAEYLDNTLTPDGVADVERVCLESDVHLAEVAACHQILTLALGEPVDVDQDARERIYALGPVGESQQLARTAAPAASQVATEPAPAKPAESDFNSRIPDYLREKPLWQKSLPYVALLVIGGVWLGSLYYDDSFHEPAADEQATELSDDERLALLNEEVPEEAAIDRLAPPPDQMEPPVVPAAKVEETEQVASVTPAPVGVEPPGRSISSIDPRPPLDAPDTDSDKPVVNVIPDSPAPATTAEPPQVAVVTPVKPEPAPVPSTTAPAAPKPEPSPAVSPPAVVEYGVADGMLLQYDKQASDWRILPKRLRVHPDDQLVVPEPYGADFDVNNGQADVTCVGPSAFTLLGPGPAGQFGFDVRQARIVVRNNDNEPFPLAIRVDGELWRIELVELDTRCGIEITPREPDAFEQDFGPDTYRGNLYVESGTVRFSDGEGRVRAVSGGNWISLNRADRAAAENINPAPLLAVPDWFEEDRRFTPTQRTSAKDFQDEFDPKLGVEAVLPGLTKHRFPRIAKIAVVCSALLDDYETLIMILAQSEHAEARQAAYTGLRQWLPRDPEHRELLAKELSRYYDNADARAVYHLLWGYRKSDLENLSVSETLVKQLTHESDAIRELAFHFVYKHTGLKNGYHPLISAGRRKAAARRFGDLINKQGALIKAE